MSNEHNSDPDTKFHTVFGFLNDLKEVWESRSALYLRSLIFRTTGDIAKVPDSQLVQKEGNL